MTGVEVILMVGIYVVLLALGCFCFLLAVLQPERIRSFQVNLVALGLFLVFLVPLIQNIKRL